MCIQSQSPRPLIGSTSSIDFPQTRRTSLFTHSAAVRCKMPPPSPNIAQTLFQKEMVYQKRPPKKRRHTVNKHRAERTEARFYHSHCTKPVSAPGATKCWQSIATHLPRCAPCPLLPFSLVISFMCGMAADCCSPDCLSCACSRHAPPPARRLPTLPPL